MSKRERNDHAGALYNQFKANGEVEQAELIQRLHLRILSEIAMNRFKWVGLPETCDPRFLEMTLFWQGLVIFTWADEYDRFLVLRGTPNGPINQNNNSVEFTTTGNAMIPSKRLSAGARMVYNPITGEFEPHEPDCVPIWSNYLRIPDSDVVKVYARRLTEIDRTIEINTEQMRQPVIFGTDPDTKLTMVNMWRDIRQGKPAIFATPATVDGVKEKVVSFETGVQSSSILDLVQLKTRVWGEAMTLLGINNASHTSYKKDRLVSGEVGENDSQVAMLRMAAMQAREQAAEQINRIYDLSVSVEWNLDPNMLIDMPNITRSAGEYAQNIVDTSSGNVGNL